MSLEHRTTRSCNLGLRWWISFVPRSINSVLLIYLGCATASWRKTGNHGCVAHLATISMPFDILSTLIFKAGQIMLNWEIYKHIDYATILTLNLWCKNLGLATVMHNAQTVYWAEMQKDLCQVCRKWSRTYYIYLWKSSIQQNLENYEKLNLQ